MPTPCLQLKIVSPARMLFDGLARSVTLPGSLSPFTILPHHAPLVSALDAGLIEYVTEHEEARSLDIDGGFAEVKNNIVVVCIA